MGEIKVVHCGLGAIGLGIARVVAATEGLKIVGASDIAPDKAGQDLGTVMGLPKKLRVKVEAETRKLLKGLRPDVAVLSTSSTLKDVKPQVLELVDKGVNVVTTCEELSFPVPAHEKAAREIDAAARKKKVRVLATGVNPGYAMDALALVLTAPCVKVERIAVTRVVNAGTRRLTLQRKVGAGLNIHQFRRAMTEGSVRHVGLPESAHMIAAALGWKLDKIEEQVEPAIAPRDLDTDYLRVAAGNVAGVKQTVRAWRGNTLAISLDLHVYVGAENPRDQIVIDATPPVNMTIAGGLAGDEAAAALVVNAIPRLLSAAPGLVTMRDLPLLHAFNPAEAKALRKR